jgi:predicted nuclease of restriction endonuclease-like RecB superfamily
MECQVWYGLKGRIQSEETKRKRSERMKGKRNALGYHHTKEARDSMSKTRRSPEYLEKMNSWIPKLGPGKRPKYGYKKGFEFSKKAGKYLGYSSSWEMHFINKCDFIDYIVGIDSPSSELMVRYNNPLDGKDHMYIPDFVLKLSNGVNAVIEIKPKCYCNDPVVISKKDAAIEFYNSLGYRYITLTEDDLFKNNLSEIAKLNKQ